MRVLQINSVCGFGSTGRIATDLYGALEENGHECCIAYGRGSASNEYQTIKIGNKLDNYMHAMETRLFDNHGLGSRGVTKKFIKDIERYNPDVIHLHNIHGYYLNIPILFAYLTQLETPIIWSFHDCWAFSGRSAYVDLDENGCLPTKTMYSYEKKDYPNTWLFDRYQRNYNFKRTVFSELKNASIITPSNWLADLTRKSFFGKYKVNVIHNGIDLHKFKHDEAKSFRQGNSLKDKKIVLGVASVWDRRKGLYFLNELAEKLDPNQYQVVIVGDTLGFKLSPKILAVQQTNSVKELADIYSAADVFVNTTLADNFPTTNLEAMACGTPVVTFRSGGSPEAIDDHVGKIVRQGDVEELTQAVINVAAEKIQYQERCYNRSMLYDKHQMYEKYLNIYRKLG